MRMSSLVFVCVMSIAAAPLEPALAQDRASGAKDRKNAARAKNVVLFLADAGGTSVIAAASLHAHGAPNRLFMQQQLPHVGLSDTSTASQIVSDSAAGMTAIVTGQRTHNGVIAQSASAVLGKQDGEALKTILEYAEEHGLSTGVISNDSLTGATPASTYAHVNNRGKTAEIFQQAFAAPFGDGIDVMIGSGRPGITKALDAAGLSIDAIATQHRRPILSSLDEVPADAARTIVLFESSEFDVEAAVRTAHRILSKNKKGYFLMVEVDTHTDRVRRGIERMVLMDKVIEKTASLVGRDTLLMLTADHSFDLQLRGGRLDAPLLDGIDESEAKAAADRAAGEKSPTLRTSSLRMENSHTGEPVIVAAKGPGAERVRGFMRNTDLFNVMMQAYGWKPTVAEAPTRPKAATNP
jgi:alkaline phosphatase